MRIQVAVKNVKVTNKGLVENNLMRLFFKKTLQIEMTCRLYE